MKLSGVDQEDPVGTPESQACKLRVLSSLDAITKLDPSPVIGPLTSIFHEIVVTLATKFNYDIHSIHAAPVRVTKLSSKFKMMYSHLLVCNYKTTT